MAKSEKSENSGKKWTPEDNKIIFERVQRGETYEQSASKIGRDVRAYKIQEGKIISKMLFDEGKSFEDIRKILGVSNEEMVTKEMCEGIRLSKHFTEHFIDIFKKLLINEHDKEKCKEETLYKDILFHNLFTW